ncbi:acyl-CoA thioesterase [Chloroflexia bacterium SDU3-3]|nr:acyl-CoA thioesterase [Chloroflexia bacterium SDU3-3]
MTDQSIDRPRLAAPEIFMADIVLPSQANGHGTMFGGEVMAKMDRAAAVAALRFCRMPVVTASTERIDFRTPIQPSEIIEARAKVIHAGRSSMIVRIHIHAEHPLEGHTRLCTTGYFSMVAIDSQGRPALVPELLLEDEEARAEWAIGEEIRHSIKARQQR